MSVKFSPAPIQLPPTPPPHIKPPVARAQGVIWFSVTIEETFKAMMAQTWPQPVELSGCFRESESYPGSVGTSKRNGSPFSTGGRALIPKHSALFGSTTGGWHLPGSLSDRLPSLPAAVLSISPHNHTPPEMRPSISHLLSPGWWHIRLPSSIRFNDGLGCL